MPRPTVLTILDKLLPPREAGKTSVCRRLDCGEARINGARRCNLVREVIRARYCSTYALCLCAAVVTLYTFPCFIKLINAHYIDSATPIPPIHALGAPG